MNLAIHTAIHHKHSIGKWLRSKACFSINQTGLGMSKDKINALAREWELRGWLTPVGRDPKTGAAVARHVKPALAQLAGIRVGADA